MTMAEQLARFVVQASYEDLSEAAREQLKIRILDSLGCAVGALGSEPVKLVGSSLRISAATAFAASSAGAHRPGSSRLL